MDDHFHMPQVRGRLTEGRMLADLTWLRVGGPADWLFQPADVADLADFRATYGSIGAVVVFLMWIYVAAYAVFFGAALATEAEIEINEREARLQAQAERAAAD